MQKTEGLQSTCRQLRIWTTLLFCLLTSAFMALEASASVDAVNQWPAVPTIVSNSNATTVTGKFTPGMGSNRLMLVAVASEYSAAQAPTFTVTYGGQPVTNIAAATNNANVNKIWVGFLNETGIIAAGANKTLQVTASTGTNLTAMYVTAAVYNGVDQAAPISGAGANSSASTAALLSVSAAYPVTGIVGNTGLSVYVANWNLQSSTAGGGHTELRDYTGANMSIATGYNVATTPQTPGTTPAAAAAGAIAGVGLKSVVNTGSNYATIVTCGDCHGNPPQDGTARNVPPGQFQGSHDKHAGTADGLQYAFACTKCHNSNTLYKHADGFRNISGTSLPRIAYSGTSKVLDTNVSGTGTCNNTACHSTGRANIQYTPSPAWGTPSANCLSCHAGRAAGNGNPAPSTLGFKLSTTHSQHLKYPAANINCNMCHSKTVSDAQTLKNYTGVVLHNNGTKDVLFADVNYGSYTSYKTAAGADKGKCGNVACHGGKTRAAWQNQGALNTNNTCTHCHGVANGITPANSDLKNFAPGWNGGTSTDQVANDNDYRVGAHFAHLSSVYTKKIKCNECHRVPPSVFDPVGSHMVGPRYNSQTVTFSQASTATKNGVFTSFTSGSAVKAVTCSTTYCHGSKFIQGDTAGSARKPAWDKNTLIARTPSAAACGTCHGLPPNSMAAYHAGATLSSCVGCHNTVVDAAGNIINKTLHINGVNNVQMTCNNCHDYDTTGGGTTWGKTNYGGTAGMEGRGAHAKHIEYLKSRNGVITTLSAATDTYGGAAFNATCGVCHNQTATNHTPGNTAGIRHVDFNGVTTRQFGAGAPTYNGVYNTSSAVNPKSCSNTDCHYRTSPVWSTY